MITHPSNVVRSIYVANWADQAPARLAWLIDRLARHNAADWGDLDPDDQVANRYNLRHQEGRLLSCYPVPFTLLEEGDTDEAVWIITDDLADPDTTTTILWPSDY